MFPDARFYVSYVWTLLFVFAELFVCKIENSEQKQWETKCSYGKESHGLNLKFSNNG